MSTEAIPLITLPIHHGKIRFAGQVIEGKVLMDLVDQINAALRVVEVNSSGVDFELQRWLYSETT